MTGSSWTEEMTARALQFWGEYQADHEIDDKMGLAVGIDPAEGRIWFGSDAIDVVRKRDADGIDTPLYFLRVGRDYYLRKGGRR
jgi:hypothetical protein